MSSAQFARLAGVKAPSITTARRRSPLKDAAIGTKIDLSADGALRYLATQPFAKNGNGHVAEQDIPAEFKIGAPKDHALIAAFLARDLEKVPTKTDLKRHGSKAVKRLSPHGPTLVLDEPVNGQVDLPTLVGWTYRDLVASPERFTSYLDAQKKAAEIQKLRLEVQRRNGELISRDFVRTHMFGALDVLFRRLLREFPVGTSRILISEVKTGATQEEVVAKFRDRISRELQAVKHEVLKALRASQPLDKKEHDYES